MPHDLEDLDSLALTGATVWPSPDAEPLEDACIVVGAGRIVRVGPRASVPVPPETRILDCAGCTITAAFWNSHVHFHERKWADAAQIPAEELERQLLDFTRYGFTSVFDLSSRWENTRRLRDRIQSGELRGPRIYSTGEGLIPTGGRPSGEVFRVLGLMETALPEVATPEQGRAAAGALLAAGVDGLKFFVSAPPAAPLAPDAIRAGAEGAHRIGKPVFAHPNDETDIATALAGGVDIIAHTTPRSGAWSAATVEAMSSCDAALIPTMMVWESMFRHDRISAREALVAASLEQLQTWIARGGTVLFGTDLGAVEADPSREFALMAQAGMTFRQILASLTTAPTRQFGTSERSGRIVEGGCADLVVLEGDPAESTGAWTSVLYTLRGGRLVYGAR